MASRRSGAADNPPSKRRKIPAVSTNPFHFISWCTALRAQLLGDDACKVEGLTCSRRFVWETRNAASTSPGKSQDKATCRHRHDMAVNQCHAIDDSELHFPPHPPPSNTRRPSNTARRIAWSYVTASSSTCTCISTTTTAFPPLLYASQQSTKLCILAVIALQHRSMASIITAAGFQSCSYANHHDSCNRTSPT